MDHELNGSPLETVVPLVKTAASKSKSKSLSTGKCP
jgi:hypothetical protein